ncbi:hypothetical protein HMN09_00561300 [Mycena chlorophos]|uniref:Uncharacterized protein n=1 Tax=Mycena chlorophos TaxID=658473 RepID=A0A8H6WGI6_MYCCL|nr:hypothetical protein HMN09_00561300 [Mycena chlorophos]
MVTLQNAGRPKRHTRKVRAQCRLLFNAGVCLKALCDEFGGNARTVSRVLRNAYPKPDRLKDDIRVVQRDSAFLRRLENQRIENGVFSDNSEEEDSESDWRLRRKAKASSARSQATLNRKLKTSKKANLRREPLSEPETPEPESDCESEISASEPTSSDLTPIPESTSGRGRSNDVETMPVPSSSTSAKANRDRVPVWVRPTKGSTQNLHQFLRTPAFSLAHLTQPLLELGVDDVDLDRFARHDEANRKLLVQKLRDLVPEMTSRDATVFCAEVKQIRAESRG